MTLFLIVTIPVAVVVSFPLILSARAYRQGFF